MPKITITGTFLLASANNHVNVIVARNDPNKYFTQNSYDDSFKEDHDDVVSGLTYDVSIAGETPGKFRLQITGDVVVPFDHTYDGPIFQDTPTFKVK